MDHLYLTDQKAAVSLKNGIRRALRDVNDRWRGCINDGLDRTIRIEYRYRVDSRGDRVRLSKLSARPAREAPLPPEVADCFKDVSSQAYEVSAAQIIPRALIGKYDPNDFFMKASFEDAETVTFFANAPSAPPAPPSR
jgi:hypothetical protein